MRTTTCYPFGVLYIYDNYCHMDLKDDYHLTLEDCKLLLQDLDKVYKKQPYVFISDRKFASSVDTEAYRHVNYKRLKGIAIVSQNENIKTELEEEQKLYKGSFAFFKDVESAKDWAKSFLSH